MATSSPAILCEAQGNRKEGEKGKEKGCELTYPQIQKFPCKSHPTISFPHWPEFNHWPNTQLQEGLEM